MDRPNGWSILSLTQRKHPCPSGLTVSPLLYLSTCITFQLTQITHFARSHRALPNSLPNCTTIYLRPSLLLKPRAATCSSFRADLCPARLNKRKDVYQCRHTGIFCDRKNTSVLHRDVDNPT
ncbi:hypothetical protein M404DRAFT_995753 [Pisolithus tinctorius Marx 270]|uniref:Uncharacterized protein n=1 Tax=Pisolithus tinctorius Marx 270 TaxID=870435 RepID=A0A0C3PNU3_PISTI|nr:hypothetical protein M404DRAFT_995753 [Pisolithus tinctorius Marx 270]